MSWSQRRSSRWAGVIETAGRTEDRMGKKSDRHTIDWRLPVMVPPKIFTRKK
jgi:hypothetical protein